MIVKLGDIFLHDRAVFSVAGAAIASPAWLPFLQDVSMYAALLLPILGVISIVAQIFAKFYRNRKRR